MTARELADVACSEFRGTKRVLLRDVGLDKITQQQVLIRLRTRYEKLQRAYLARPETDYATWLEHGPRDELLEVTEAARDPSVWDRLVETYERRHERA